MSRRCSYCGDITVHIDIHYRVNHPEKFHKLMERRAKEKMEYVENCNCEQCKKYMEQRTLV